MAEIWDENVTVITGQLFRDPTMVSVDGERECRLLVVHRYREHEDEVHWFRCRVRGELAESVHRRLRKNMNVYIRGASIPQKTFTDEKGVERSIMYIVVERIRLIADDR